MANPIFGVLAPDCVGRQDVPLGQSFALRHLDGSGERTRRSSCSTFPARWRCTSRGGRDTDLAGQPGDTVGVEVRAGEQRLLYIPGCARHDRRPERRLAGASVVLFDGTLWRDDEMMRARPRPQDRDSAWGI